MTDQILSRNYLIKDFTEGNIKRRVEVTGRSEGRCKQLLDDLKETIGYCKLKYEEPDRIRWRTVFGRGYKPVVGMS